MTTAVAVLRARPRRTARPWRALLLSCFEALVVLDPAAHACLLVERQEDGR